MNQAIAENENQEEVSSGRSIKDIAHEISLKRTVITLQYFFLALALASGILGAWTIHKHMEHWPHLSRLKNLIAFMSVALDAIGLAWFLPFLGAYCEKSLKSSHLNEAPLDSLTGVEIKEQTNALALKKSLASLALTASLVFLSNILGIYCVLNIIGQSSREQSFNILLLFNFSFFAFSIFFVRNCWYSNLVNAYRELSSNINQKQGQK